MCLDSCLKKVIDIERPFNAPFLKGEYKGDLLILIDKLFLKK